MLNIELLMAVCLLISLVTVLGYRWLRSRDTFAQQERPVPSWVRFCQSLWPVLLAVMLVRGFIAEPFRIPSESMMPTLNVGDFIGVTKYSYDLRLPVTHQTLWSTGSPQRGDVVVFRFPGYWCQVAGQWQRSGDRTCREPNAPVPNETWIKRVIGLPGDHISMIQNELTINSAAIAVDGQALYPATAPRLTQQTGLDANAWVGQEHLGSVTHTIAHMPVVVQPPDLPNEHNPEVVPPDCFLVMGDNRENSIDSRWWSCVPRANLVGKAQWIWFSGQPGKTGTHIH